MSPSSGAGSRATLFGAMGLGALSSACCTLPLVAVSAGVGGSWLAGLAWMEPYRWWFIGGALLLLGFAGFREYRVSKEPDCDCEDGVSPKARRTLLLVAALVTLGAAASPELLAPAGPQEVAASNQLHRVVLAVEGMTCPTCTLTVEKALGDLEGAVVVGVTYEPPHATVDLDPARWNASDAIASIEAVGYTAQLVWEENDGDE